MTISVKPLDGPLGAEIRGLDARNITAEDRQALLDAFNAYHLLIVHGPTITDDELVEFGKSFGHIEKARKKSPLSDRDDIMVISNIRQDGELVGSLPDGEMSYHFDRIHQAQPCKGAALHGLEIPSEGGDTCFANMVRAYETLPEATKKRIEGLKALNTFTYGATKRDSKDELGPHAIHPIVRHDPRDGQEGALRLPPDDRQHRRPARGRERRADHRALRPHREHRPHLSAQVDGRRHRASGTTAAPATRARIFRTRNAA